MPRQESLRHRQGLPKGHPCNLKQTNKRTKLKHQQNEQATKRPYRRNLFLNGPDEGAIETFINNMTKSFNFVFFALGPKIFFKHVYICGTSVNGDSSENETLIM